MSERKRDFTFAQQCSIGFRSGEYVGRNRPGAHSFNRVLDVIEFMNGVVIHHHRIAAFERGHEQLFDKEQHGLPINRSGHTQAGADAIEPNRTDRGHVAATVPRHLIVDPLAGFCTAIVPGQPKITAHFVYKDEVFTIKSAREVTKLGASRFIAFTSDETFFSEGGSGPVSCGKSWTDSPWRGIYLRGPSATLPASHRGRRGFPDATASFLSPAVRGLDPLHAEALRARPRDASEASF